MVSLWHFANLLPNGSSDERANCQPSIFLTPFDFKMGIRDTFPLGMSCDGAFASELTTPFVALANSFCGSATKQVRSLIRCQQKRQVQDLSFLLAENQRFELNFYP